MEVGDPAGWVGSLVRCLLYLFSSVFSAVDMFMYLYLVVNVVEVVSVKEVGYRLNPYNHSNNYNHYNLFILVFTI